MKYEETLAKQIVNPDGALWFQESWPHSQLDGMARDFIARGTPEGYFSAVLIFHQLVEEILRLLIRYSNLLVRANLYPIKVDLLDGKDMTLGKLIKVHESTIQFQHKSKIIGIAVQINKIRTDLAHKLLNYPSELSITKRINETDKIYDELFKLWQQSMRWFYSEINKAKERKQIVRLLNRYS